MRKKNGIVLSLLLCFLLMFNVTTAFAAEGDPVSGKMSVDGTKVTVVLTIAEDSQTTNGEAQVTYDSSKLTLVSAEGSQFWDVENINTEYETEDAQKTVSLMFSKVEPLTEGGTILTLVFTAKDDSKTFEADVEVKLHSDLKSIVDPKDESVDQDAFKVSAERPADPQKPDDEKPTAPSQNPGGSNQGSGNQGNNNSQGSSTQNPGTGDFAPIGMWTVIALCAAAAVFFMSRRFRKAE